MASIETINTTQANIEAPVEIQLSLSSPIYRGPVGPTGPRGADGRSGVWVGEATPDTGYEVWIDPNGEAIDTPVGSINGKTGVVVLTPEDIGALSADTEIQHFELLSNTEILDIWNNM